MSGKPKKISPSIEAFDRERLRVNDLLIGLDDEAFDKFAQRCEFVTFRKGDNLIEEGSKQDYTFLMVKGMVRVVQGEDSEDSNMGFIYQEIGEGGWFGEIAALDKGQRTATVLAITDGIAVIMPRAVFVNLILEHRQIAVKVLESLASIIRSSNRRLSDVSSFSGVQRVYLQLLELAEPDPSADGIWTIDNMPSHEQLATIAMTSKEVVSKAISQILQAGLAKRSSGKLKILDHHALKRVATEI